MKDIDPNNLKALYLHGKSCLELKRFDDAINSFKKLTVLSPDNSEFSDPLKEAQLLFNQDLKKQKNIFKKMIFSHDN